MSAQTGKSPSSRRLGEVDVLIPTFERPAALAITLTGLAGQTFRSFGVIVSDQSADPVGRRPEVRAVARVLKADGRKVRVTRNLPPRGMAQQRESLLARSKARYVLFLDDDLLLEPRVLERMVATIRQEGCGFVGCAPIGLSYLADERPQEQLLEPWEGPVRPERVVPGSAEWQRYRLHNAANVRHVERRLGLTGDTDGDGGGGERIVRYHVAWVGGCVLYDAEKLREAGAFSFWRDLPLHHSGEDVLVQLRLMERFGGCGILPSGVVHLELPTTLPVRQVDAPLVLSV